MLISAATVFIVGAGELVENFANIGGDGAEQRQGGVFGGRGVGRAASVPSYQHTYLT